MLPLVNEDFEFGCADSTGMEVDLSGLSAELCFVVNKDSNATSKGKALVKGVTINVTAATGSVTTSLIDGSSITFVSAVGTIMGNSQKTIGTLLPFCLADENLLPAQALAYTGDGSMGTLVVTGTNSSSGATVVDNCKIWFKKAGQNVGKAT